MKVPIEGDLEKLKLLPKTPNTLLQMLIMSHLSIKKALGKPRA